MVSAKTVEVKSAPPQVAGAAGRRAVSRTLERELQLSPQQLSRIDEVLLQRDAEIRNCHDEIRKSGFLDIRATEWEFARLKDSWYRRIDALLSTGQHATFVVLVENGLFNEGLAFTVEPGMTVLE